MERLRSERACLLEDLAALRRECQQSREATRAARRAAEAALAECSRLEIRRIALESALESAGRVLGVVRQTLAPLLPVEEGPAAPDMPAALLRERRRLAQDLHDGLTQDLNSVLLEIEAGRTLLTRDPRRAAEELQLAAESARRALAVLRQQMASLWEPPGQMLDERLRQLALEIGQQHGLRVDVAVRGEPSPTPATVESAVLRVARQALINVRCHAGVETARLTLSYTPGQVVLRVEDDGVGFVPGEALRQARVRRHFGLLGMQEQAASVQGTLTIDSQPGRGTRIELRAPIELPGGEQG